MFAALLVTLSLMSEPAPSPERALLAEMKAACGGDAWDRAMVLHVENVVIRPIGGGRFSPPATPELVPSPRP